MNGARHLGKTEGVVVDTAKLRELAQAAYDDLDEDLETTAIWDRYHKATHPSEILALLDTLEQYRNKLADINDGLRTVLGDDIEGMERERIEDLALLREQYRADAERYRWIRARLHSADFAYGEPPVRVITFRWPHAPIGADLDASIDAVRGARSDTE